MNKFGKVFVIIMMIFSMFFTSYITVKADVILHEGYTDLNNKYVYSTKSKSKHKKSESTTESSDVPFLLKLSGILFGLVITCACVSMPLLIILPVFYRNKVTDKKLQKLGMSKDDFEKLAFDIYVKIQKASMNFDYKELKKYTTEDFYLQYERELIETELIKNKNVMSDFELHDIKITGIIERENILEVTVFIKCSMFDYVIDASKEIIKGTDQNKIIATDCLTFVRTLEPNIKCPRCGNNVDTSISDECSYCHDIVEKPPIQYFLNKKIRVNEVIEK